MMPLSKAADNILKASTMSRALNNTLGLVQRAGFDGKSGLGGMFRDWGDIQALGQGWPRGPWYPFDCALAA